MADRLTMGEVRNLIRETGTATASDLDGRAARREFVRSHEARSAVSESLRAGDAVVWRLDNLVVSLLLTGAAPAAVQ